MPPHKPATTPAVVNGVCGRFKSLELLAWEGCSTNDRVCGEFEERESEERGSSFASSAPACLAVLDTEEQESGRLKRAEVEATTRELRGLIYAAILEEVGWDDFLDRLRNLLPGGTATVFFHDAQAGRGAFSLASGLSEAALAAYADHYCALNPWMEAAARRPIGLAVPDCAMLDRAALHHSEFFNDFMRPLGLKGAVGVTVAREAQCNFMLSILGAAADTADRRSLLAVLRAVVPDLRRAFAFYRRSPNAAVACPHRVVRVHS